MGGVRSTGAVEPAGVLFQGRIGEEKGTSLEGAVWMVPCRKRWYLPLPAKALSRYLLFG